MTGKKEMKIMYDIGIIGGGTAGMTAAIYGQRAGKRMNRYEVEYVGGNERQPDSVKEFSTSNKELAGSRNIKKPHIQTKNKDDRS